MTEKVRPQKGDIWEFKLPGKPRRRKQVGCVSKMLVDKYDRQGNWVKQVRVWYVQWYRLPKGRYTGIRLAKLMEVGKRISTKAERDAEMEARWKRYDHDPARA